MSQQLKPTRSEVLCYLVSLRFPGQTGLEHLGKPMSEGQSFTRAELYRAALSEQESSVLAAFYKAAKKEEQRQQERKAR